MSDLNKKELKILEQEINSLSDDLLEISLDMIQGGYTEYPIYVAHPGNVEDMGEELFNAHTDNLPYSINVTMLEDFVESGIIPEDKIELFKTAYGDPKKFMCIFFVSTETASFVFYPYAKRNTDNK